LKVIRADFAGFCFGVKRAYRLASEKYTGKVSTLGELIHNPEILEELDSKGVKVENTISKIQKGVVIIRAHGISKKKLRELQQKKVKIVDASCPFVKRLHREAEIFVERGIPVFILGKRKHPELSAVLEDFPEVKIVEKIHKKNYEKYIGQKVALLAQTTERVERFEAFKKFLREIGVRVLAKNTICNATRERQDAALYLATNVDVMIVIGGKNSNNTKQLFDLTSELTQSFWIESEKNLQKKWFEKTKKVGITAGASTPERVIERVERRLNSF